VVLGPDKRKLALVVLLCLIAILSAVYMGMHTFATPKFAYPPGFDKYGPNGPPDARPGPAGSIPGRR
jgi:hypothetical protein